MGITIMEVVMSRRFALVLLFVLVAMSAHAATRLAWDSKVFMGIDEIKPGMTGYGKTVFQGTKIETFNVTVIGVLRKIDVDFDMILIKVTSGPVVERKLQTVEGMSGSPIYINGRLIGAYAFGWNFEQEAVAGVTPIAAMLDCAQPGSAGKHISGILRAANGALHIGKTRIDRVQVAGTAQEAKRLRAEGGPNTMVLSPLATPVLATGLPHSMMEKLQRDLSAQNYNIQLESGMGSGYVDTLPPPPASLTMEPGSAIAVPICEGDVNLAAVGTVTYVKGDTVLAFGHPFFLAGNTNMPMYVAYITHVLSSAHASFKLGMPYKRVGTLVQDRYHAVVGELGKDPHTIPFNIYYGDTTRGAQRKLSFRMVDHPVLTPVFGYRLGVLMPGMLASADMPFARGTYTASYSVATDTLGTIRQQSTCASLQSVCRALPHVLAVCQDNPYAPAAITGVNVFISYNPAAQIAFIERVVPDRQIAHPGETVNLDVTLRPYGKALETKRVSVTVPLYTNDPLMLVAVTSGAGDGIRQLLTPPFYPEEGLKGMVRWLTSEIPASQLLVGQVSPSPTAAYRGQLLPNLPTPVLSCLRAGELTYPSSYLTGQRDSAMGEAELQTRPTLQLQEIAMPYLLVGGVTVPIVIDAQDRHAGALQNVTVGGQAPAILSASLQPAPAPATPSAPMETALWQILTPFQRSLFANPVEASLLTSEPGFTLPTLRLDGWYDGPALSSLADAPHWERAHPACQNHDGPALSSLADAPPQLKVDDVAKPAPAQSAPVPPAPAEVTRPDAAKPAEKKDDPTLKSLLLNSAQSWTLAGSKDFQAGTHIGTAVTSKGRLVLAPAVKARVHITGMLPWRLTSTAKGIYVAGWQSRNLLCVPAAGEAQTITPELPIESITALAADPAGNLLLAGTPGNLVALLDPTGKVLRRWTLPAGITWDVAVTRDGRYFAAESTGKLLALTDDEKTPAAVAFTAPDQQIYRLAVSGESLYLATQPRGKVFRVAKDGAVRAVFEAKDAIASLAADAAGNVYLGATPTCEVLRVAPDGSCTTVSLSLNKGAQHVMALAVAGSDLYAATGSSGGIYRIKGLAEGKPEVTMIFAREDLRHGLADVSTLGSESVLVNDLAVTATGDIYAAASGPGQVLQLIPRTEGDFLSPVIPSPAVSSWGRVELRAGENASSLALIETRSGNIAFPDDLWSPWASLRAGAYIASPPASYAQIHLHLVAKDAAVEYVRAQYLPANQPPTLKVFAPANGAIWSGKKELKWEGKDAENSKLVYTVSYSADGVSWTLLDLSDSKVADKPAEKDNHAVKMTDVMVEKPAYKPTEKSVDKPADKPSDKPSDKSADKSADKPAPPVKPVYETNESNVPIDTTRIPDGKWLLKVTASQKYAKPVNPLSASVTVSALVVDNTPPTTNLPGRADSWAAVQEFLITDNLTPIAGGKFRLDTGPWIALTPVDGLFDNISKRAKLLLPDGLPKLSPGEHTLQLAIVDSAENWLLKKVMIVVPEK